MKMHYISRKRWIVRTFNWSAIHAACGFFAWSPTAHHEIPQCTTIKKKVMCETCKRTKEFIR